LESHGAERHVKRMTRQFGLRPIGGNAGGQQDKQQIRQGMTVFTADGQKLGTVERIQGTTRMVKGQSIPQSAVARVTKDGVYLASSHAAGEQDGEMRVAVAEEQLAVGKREVDLGEIMIRKRLVVEERMVPVTLRREEVEIVRREAGQPWPADMGENEPGVEVTRLPLRGEEPALDISQVVAREVVVERGVQAEERQVAGTVRREQIAIDEYQGGANLSGRPVGIRRMYRRVTTTRREEQPT
jgi:uncharacterized protein (TIGR02271 family)